MVNVPAPDTAGLNVLEETPVPLNVPPTGEPVNVIAALVVVVLGYEPALTVGNGLTVKFKIAIESHPAAFVVVYE
jgi:hypothetical protein